MKILHTSDWHLGQSFLTKSRSEEHQAFIKWLLELIVKESIDAVIIAGDIFDTGTPPSYAREIYNQFVVAISKLNCTLIVLAGNHDSVSTLNESKDILACLNTYVVASTCEDINKQLFTLHNSQGEVGAILCAVPFIRPRDLLTSTGGETGLQKRQALGYAIKEHYHTLYTAAVDLRDAKGVTVPIITTGHLTALGVSQSESVRDIYIGSLDGFSADDFPPADYIALGHIHRPQKVAKSDHIRYSGSPIPLSFDELKYNKQVVIVEFDECKNISITPVDIPLFQPMAVLIGDLDAIKVQLESIVNALNEQPTWLFIEVEVQDHYSDLQQRVMAMADEYHVEVLKIKRSRGKNQPVLTQQLQETLAELDPFDVFNKRLALECIEGDDAEAQLERIKNEFKEIVSEVEYQEPSA